MRITLAQINPTVGDFEGNAAKILKTIERSRRHSPDIILFSELAICGYPPQDLVLHPSFVDDAFTSLEKIIRASSGLMVVVGLVRRNLTGHGEKSIFNSAAIICDGELLGFYDKCLLPTYDVFDERRYFEPGTSVPVWEYKGKKIGVIICEDIWQHSGYVDLTHYARDPIQELIPLKPDLLLNLSASPYQYQKPDVRVEVCRKAAKTLHCPIALCCQVGGNDELVFDGYSVAVDASGHLLQLAKGFEEDEILVDTDAPFCSVPFHYNGTEDLYRALVLGVRDYFRKQGFKRGCLGMSGGIDSALVACIACDALGKENILGIAMPSRYSSDGSLQDAKTLAKNLDIPLQVIPIEDPFQTYLDLLVPVFSGKAVDVTEENLQSRIRGTILMAISNKLDYIVLSTGNKSELGMGYCTLYGDMAGGLGVISDVFKTQVYELARWVNRNREIIPRSCIEKPPSAELRPNQKDSDSLPDYAVLDAVLQTYLENYLSAEEIAEKLKLKLPLVESLIKKLHCCEYKRRQAPPGIRVSRKALKAGRQYPIVQAWV